MCRISRGERKFREFDTGGICCDSFSVGFIYTRPDLTVRERCKTMIFHHISSVALNLHGAIRGKVTGDKQFVLDHLAEIRLITFQKETP